MFAQGKEIILRYDTDLVTNGVFSADSNAREMIERTYNKVTTAPLSV
jgi:hypothetical protein